MQQFMREFIQLNGTKAKVLLEHHLFDRQAFDCDRLQMVNNSERIGVVLKGQEKYIDKCNIKLAEIQNNTYILSDGRLTITVVVNSL